MPPSHTLKDTTNHGGIYKCTQPTGKQKTIHSHGHVHVQIWDQSALTAPRIFRAQSDGRGTGSDV